MIFSGSNFFETDDGTILYYEDYGKGEPIILLHGFCASSQVFKRNIEELSKEHRLVLMDLRGHGSSSKTLTGVTITRMAADVQNLIEYLKLSDVTLLGWSMGGQVALAYWRRFAGYGCVKRMGILDATLYPFSDEDWNRHGCRNFNMDAANKRLNGMLRDPEKDAENMVNGMVTEAADSEDREWIKGEILKTPPYIAFSVYSDFIYKDFTEYIPSLLTPTLFIGSSCAAVKGIIAAEYYISKCTAPYEFVKFENGGHFFFYFEPEKFNRAVLDFMARYPIGKR